MRSGLRSPAPSSVGPHDKTPVVLVLRVRGNLPKFGVIRCAREVRSVLCWIDLEFVSAQ